MKDLFIFYFKCLYKNINPLDNSLISFIEARLRDVIRYKKYNYDLLAYAEILLG